MHLSAVRPRLALPALAALALVLLAVPPAPAVILKLTPLKEVLDGEQLIFVASVGTISPEKPIVVFKVEEKLKGDAIPFEQLRVNLTGDAEAKKHNETRVMLDRLEAGRKLVAFVSKRGKKYSAFCFLEGTWFQLQGTPDAEAKTVRWAFLHCEPYLRRTFKGTTAELKKVVQDGLAKKADPPAPNEKEPPGYGPPVKKKCGMGNSECGMEDQDPTRVPVLPGSSGGHSAFRIPHSALLGVIPSVVLLGPVALLAALFPGLAARMAVGMKRWRAFLVVASVNSCLAIVYYFTQKYLPDWWVFSPKGFTITLMVSTGIGLSWAGRRYRRMASEDSQHTETPARSDVSTLAGMTLLVGLIVASTRFFGPWSTAVELPMREFTFIGLGLLAATLYTAYRLGTRCADRTPQGTDPVVRLSLSGETVGLGVLFLCGLVTVLNPGPRTTFAVGTEAGEGGAIGPQLVGDGQAFPVEKIEQVMSGITVDGDRLYFGASKQTGFGVNGYVVCMNRNTGEVLWRFDNDEELKPVFCTPTVADGKVYFGEGLHTDSGCKLYCLDAKTGKPAWEKPYETASHTEGTPRVANGRVYFSAGDDGLICADAKTGAKVWHFEGKPQKLHIDTPPTVVGNRVFAGSGYDTYALLCIDATTGKELWRTPVELRSFGNPLVAGKHAFYGIGTGNLTLDTEGDEKKPAGAVVCVEAETGKPVWRYDLERSVHTSLAADTFSVYATARDGFVHCLDRKTGKLRWKTGLGGAMLAAPTVATEGRLPLAVYSVSREGALACLNPQTGQVLWQKPLPGFNWDGQEANGVFCAPALVVSETPAMSKRAIYVGGMTVSEQTRKKTCAVFRFEDEFGE